MAQGEKLKKNSPLSGIGGLSKLKKAEQAVEKVAARISYSDFRNTALRIIRAK